MFKAIGKFFFFIACLVGSCFWWFKHLRIKTGEMDYLKTWISESEKVKEAVTLACEASEALNKIGKHHRSENPLDQETKEAIVTAFMRGDPLCCEEGLETLKGLGLDECWTDYINNWAYEMLGCDESYKPGGSLHMKGLGKLRKKLKIGITIN